MNYKKILVCLLFSVIGFMFTFSGSAQPLQTISDKTNILIGEQIHYQARLNLAAAGYNVSFDIPDSVAHFEILQRQQFDTVDKKGQYSLIQTIVFTSFDSGKWVIPSFRVSVSSPNKLSKIFYTDSLSVNVGYSPSDSLGLRDIKTVLGVYIADYTIAYIIAGALLLILIIWLVYRYFRKRKKKIKPAFVFSLNAYDEANEALEKLKSMKLSTKEYVKIYYTTLSEIFKKYYSSKEQRNVMNFTTTEMLLHMKSHTMLANGISPVAELLRLADAVKFAKHIPPQYEHDIIWKQAKMIIDSLEKNYIKK